MKISRTVVTALLAGLPLFAASQATLAGISRAYSVPARSTEVIQLTLNAGGNAQIRITGDGDTDLDLYVYDANGELCRSVGSSDREACTFQVLRSGVFRVEVRNLGAVHNRYWISVN